ncbi:MAG: hypothetical protein ACI4LI_00230 [Candidatus Fimenecus sp.]
MVNKLLKKCPKVTAFLDMQKSKQNSETDRVHQLAEGLSTATTIAQIRAVAQSILDETEGDAV